MVFIKGPAFLSLLICKIIRLVLTSNKKGFSLDLTNMIRIFLLPVLLFYFTASRGQGNANIHCSLRDKNGILWFGTTGSGIYRYDGHSFIHFTEKNSSINNFVWTVFESRNGDLWFGTDAGLWRYNGTEFFNFPETSGLPKTSVWSIYEDKIGTFWIGTGNKGVYRYDGKTFSPFLINSGVINRSGLHLREIQSIIEDKN